MRIVLTPAAADSCARPHQSCRLLRSWRVHKTYFPRVHSAYYRAGLRMDNTPCSGRYVCSTTQCLRESLVSSGRSTAGAGVNISYVHNSGRYPLLSAKSTWLRDYPAQLLEIQHVFQQPGRTRSAPSLVTPRRQSSPCRWTWPSVLRHSRLT